MPLALLLSMLPLQSTLHVGQVITRSVRVSRAEYELQAKDEVKSPVITIHGDNLVVDFSGATIRGSSEDTPPDQRSGLAILVDGSHNVTIKNARIHGYRLAILARNSSGVRLTNCDWSYNWKQHLKSTVDKEDESDWMSFHHNENDEWIYADTPFGAGGVYLRGCSGFKVDHCTATGTQCGLMLNRCDHGLVLANDFSFLSAIGIGLYRSSDNRIFHNGLDYCVRGYSHLMYSRGQDSASILVYEQSNRNVFAYNSATRGGDGFFLWAGQTTMDTGDGGCNDNVLYGNDFSHSPANGIEATFSRNTFVDNRLVECWHGVWGGFSFDSKWIGNVFKLCNQAFAIEHGQNNLIEGNSVADCDEGAALWMVPHRNPDIEYMKKRDIESHGYSIKDNLFVQCRGAAVSLKETKSSTVSGNVFSRCTGPVQLQGDTSGVTQTDNKAFPRATDTRVGPPYVFSNGNNDPARTFNSSDFGAKWSTEPGKPFPDLDSGFAQTVKVLELTGPVRLPSPALKHLVGASEWGREHILVDEWGPYDYRCPIVWRSGKPSTASTPDDGLVHLRIEGPAGQWRTISAQGAEVVGPGLGAVPGQIALRLTPGQMTDLKLVLEYSGSEVVTRFGKHVAAGTPYRFSYSQFFAPIDWHVQWFKWDANSDPRDPAGWTRVLASPVIKTASTQKLDYAGNGAFAPGLPPDHYATVAEGTFAVPVGSYTLSVTTDDGARAWVDGKLVIGNAWHYQGPTLYKAELNLAQGLHKIRVEHFQIDGYAALQVSLERAH